MVETLARKLKHRILVVAAHPDDEALGCGGALVRHAEEGAKIGVVFVTDGEGARAGAAKDAVRKREKDARRAGEILGIDDFEFVALPDNQLDSLPLLDITQKIERAIGKFEPDVIYTHHGGDLNIDHRIVHQAVMTACRPLPGSSVRQIYAFEVASSTEWATPAIGEAFRPNRFVDISATLGRKVAALEAYRAEMRPFPHARSIQAVQALAAWRGASVGLKAAEAFVLLRSIET